MLSLPDIEKVVMCSLVTAYILNIYTIANIMAIYVDLNVNRQRVVSELFLASIKFKS